MASQSSTDAAPAGVANDGIIGAGYSGVSDTSWEKHPWWKVTFDKPYFISSINVHGRSDWPYDGGLRISVFLFNSDGVEVWSKTDVALETLTTISPDTSKGASGSLKVEVYKYNGGDSSDLQLAEVVATGDTTAPHVDVDPLPIPPADGATPEPATYFLMAGGLAFIVIIHRRKR